MSLDPSLYLKWLDTASPELVGIDHKLVNLCTIVALDGQENLRGFTVFDPREFTEDLLGRIAKRQARPELNGCKFVMYLPPFLQHRAESFSTKNKSLKIVYTPFVRIRHEASQSFSVRSKIRVMSVDDSPVLLKFLRKAMEDMGFIEVVEQISDPMHAVAAIQKQQPDLVTMDIQMPGKTGVEVVKDLLAVEYFPIIMISSVSLAEGTLVIEALNRGAFDYIQKPHLEDLTAFKVTLAEKALCAITGRNAKSALKAKPVKKPVFAQSGAWPTNLLWCIGSSTGGTQALTRVFTNLPTSIPPTLIVQHIPAVFSRAFADSLNQLCPFTVKEAQDGDLVRGDHVYIAPGGMQMGVEQRGAELRVCIRDVAPVNRFKPSVDYLFADVAKLDRYRIVAAVLTGMGRDGAQGLLTLLKKGAKTFAQNEASSAVYGMPRAAFEIGGTDRLVDLDDIAQELMIQSASTRKSA